jgi:ATP-binding cassette subfamily B protein
LSSSTTTPPKAALHHLQYLLPLLRPYRRQIIYALCALLVAASTVMVLGQGLRQVIDLGLRSNDPSRLNQIMLLFLIVIVVMAVSTYVRFYWVSWLGERVIADVRTKVFAHLLTLSPQFYDSTRTGDIVSRLTNDTTMLETVIGSSLSMALRNSLMLIGGLVMLFVTSIKLSIIVLLGVPLVVAPILLFGRRVRQLSKDSQERLGDVSAQLDESLHEMRTVQAYAQERHTAHLFDQRIEAVIRTAKQRIQMRAQLIATVIVLAFGAIGFILWTGGHDVIAGQISPGELSAFVFYAVIVASAVGTISEVWGDLQRAAGATERLVDLLNTPATIGAPEHARHLTTPVRGEIQINKIDFYYPTRPQQAALSAFSLSIAPGETVALVGPSGAGKSTVFQMLLRFYDPAQGSIFIDGVDIKQLSPQHLREHIALVSQDAVIFSGSLRDNVRYAKPDASDNAVLAACDAAFVSEFLATLPEGLDSQLGERGVRLSGGQKQRIAIARAILADRPILLLDEATSALDAESERVVQMALERLMQHRTCIVIAHRLATVRHANRIAVIDKGMVQAIGCHDELVKSNTLYAQLASLQFRADQTPVENS